MTTTAPASVTVLSLPELLAEEVPDVSPSSAVIEPDLETPVATLDVEAVQEVAVPEASAPLVAKAGLDTGSDGAQDLPLPKEGGAEEMVVVAEKQGLAARFRFLKRKSVGPRGEVSDSPDSFCYIVVFPFSLVLIVTGFLPAAANRGCNRVSCRAKPQNDRARQEIAKTSFRSFENEENDNLVKAGKHCAVLLRKICRVFPLL